MVMLCQRQGSEEHEPPHATTPQDLESKLTMYATTWDEKIKILKLEMRGVNEKVT